MLKNIKAAGEQLTVLLNYIRILEGILNYIHLHNHYDRVYYMILVIKTPILILSLYLSRQSNSDVPLVS